MRIVNYTQLPEAELKALLEFAAKGTSDAGVEIHVKNEPQQPHGWAYGTLPKVANVAAGTRSLITLHLPSTADSPLWPRKWGWHGLKRLTRMYPLVPLEGWKDCVVTLGAHEFRHIWQHHRKQRAKGNGEQVSGKGEYDAEKHAIRILNLYRQSTGRSVIKAIKQPNPFAKDDRQCVKAQVT